MYLVMLDSASDEALQVNVGVVEAVQVLELGLVKSKAVGAVLSTLMVQVEVEAVVMFAPLTAATDQVWFPVERVSAVIEDVEILSLLSEPSM